MIYFLLISVVSLVVLAVLLSRAPRGWQDEDGFHLGQQPCPAVDEPPLGTEPATVEQATTAPVRRQIRKAA
jgi:hypothetical protein